jgi:transcriptional regulator with XRE-family HTH domain
MGDNQRTKSKLSVRFGTVVRERRREIGLSQEQLALNANLDRSYLSEVERGLKSPTLETVEALALALDTVPSALLLAAERLSARE